MLILEALSLEAFFFKAPFAASLPGLLACGEVNKKYRKLLCWTKPPLSGSRAKAWQW